MTPLALLLAVIAVCAVCSTVMILVMVADSPTPAWYRRLNLGSIVAGLAMVGYGVFQFSVARKSEESGRPSHYKGAPVTATQRYVAGVGFVVLGSAAAMIAVLQRKRGSDDASTRPTI